MNEQNEQMASEHRRVITESYWRGVKTSSLIWAVVVIILLWQNYKLIGLVADVVLNR